MGVVVVGLAAPLALAAFVCARTGKARAAELATCMFVAFACSAVGAVALRVIMYGVGTSVERFIYQ